MSRPVRATAVALAAAVLAALALTGCGGSGPAAQTSPLSASTGKPAAAVPTSRRLGAARRAHARHAVPDRRRATAPHTLARRGTFSAVATGNVEALNQLAATVDVSQRTTSRAASASTSPGEFASAADAICSAYRRTVRTTGAQATTLAAQQDELSTLVGETATALGQLTALAPPAGEQGALARFIGLTRASVGDFVKAQARSSSTSESTGTASETQDLTLAQRSAEDALGAQAAARQLGLHVCGSQGAEWL